jgi:hypothetical protein
MRLLATFVWWAAGPEVPEDTLFGESRAAELVMRHAVMGVGDRGQGSGVRHCRRRSGWRS